MTDLRQELTSKRPSKPAAAALGVFDGVHLGHRRLFAALVEAAEKRGLSPVALTLANHPLSVLRPDAEVRMLTSFHERMRLLSESGVEAVVPITFTREVAMLTPREFMTALRDCLGLAHFVAGPDVALGRNREGTLDVITELGAELGYTLESVGQFAVDGVPVRSAAVRAALQAGDVALAARLLGRPFVLDGPVVEGEGRGGGLLGYPTANVGVGPLQALPADGVYAAWLLRAPDRLPPANRLPHADRLSANDSPPAADSLRAPDRLPSADRLPAGNRLPSDDRLPADRPPAGDRLPAAVSIGHKPTFHATGFSVVEAFVLDFEGDLYGEQVKLEFAARLRRQEKFPNADALIAAMQDDVERARRILASPEPRDA